MGFRSLVAIAVACSICVHVTLAWSDPPACRVEGETLTIRPDGSSSSQSPASTAPARGRSRTPTPPRVTQLATLRATDDATTVVMRVLPRAARGATRVLAGVFDANGAWSTPLHEITSFPARVDGPIGIAAANGTTRVLVAGVRALRSVQWRDGETATITNVASTTRFASRVASFASHGDHFTLAWHVPNGLEYQALPADTESTEALHHLRVPEGARVIDIAAGPSNTLGLVMQTSARRYYVATIDSNGRFHWTGNAPAGCSQHFCAGVRLRPAPSGWVAVWLNRRGRDGLATPGAWALDADGHGIGGRREFLPMLRGEGIAGPAGEAFALQLARPMILRGASAPIVVTAREADSTARPRVVESVVDDGALRVSAWWDDGAVTVARVRCE